MDKTLAILLVLISTAMSAQVLTPLVKFANPPSVHTPKGYSQVAQIDLGKSKMLIMSGQVPLDKAGHLVGENDMAMQTDQVFRNIKSIVESGGGTMNDVVKLSYYLVDVSQIAIVRQVRDRYINAETPPASTLVEVRKLFRDDVLLEVEATAIIPNK